MLAFKFCKWEKNGSSFCLISHYCGSAIPNILLSALWITGLLLQLMGQRLFQVPCEHWGLVPLPSGGFFPIRLLLALGTFLLCIHWSEDLRRTSFRCPILSSSAALSSPRPWRANSRCSLPAHTKFNSSHQEHRRDFWFSLACTVVWKFPYIILAQS